MPWLRSKARHAASGWTGPRPFVGRAAQMRQLEAELERVAEEGGRTVFVLGPDGAGKTAVLDAARELAKGRKGWWTAGAQVARPEGPASRSALAPLRRAASANRRGEAAGAWADLLRQATRRKRLQHFVWNVAPGWAGVVPVVGDVASALVSSAAVMLRKDEDHDAHPDGAVRAETAVAAVRALVKSAAGAPGIVTIDALERASSAELAGASALVRALPETRLLFVISCDTSEGRAPEGVAHLIDDCLRAGRGRELVLPRLTPDEVHDAVTRALGAPPPEAWHAWLAARATGAAVLWETLGELERTGQLRRAGKRAWTFADAPPQAGTSPAGGPPTARRLSPQLARLSPEDRRLLTTAALEGTRFQAATVARAAGMPELDVEDRLAAFGRMNLVRFHGTTDATGDLTSTYEFVRVTDAEALAAEPAAPAPGGADEG